MTERPGARRDGAANVDTNCLSGSQTATADADRAARFAEIIDRHQGALLRYVRRTAGRRQDQVEDVVQECFLRLHRAWGESPEPPMQRVGAWLFTVAHNLTMDLIRKQAHSLAAQGDLAQEAEAADEFSVLGQITQSEAAAAALTALDRLPVEQKHVVLMKVLQGLTFRQIAKATGLSLGNVNYRLNQALGTLARQLRQSGHL